MSVSPAVPQPGTIPTAPVVPFRAALHFWFKLGLINFGGPAGQIAIMHQELVERRQWISERQFLRALNFCMLLPGPEAQQLAAYMGWRLHGIPGGIVAGSLFVLPAIFVLLLLSWLSVAYAQIPAIAGLFYGIKAVVLAIVLEALIRIGQRAFLRPIMVVFAIGALVGLRLLNLSFPLIIAGAALGGLLLYRWQPHIFRPAAPDMDGRSSAEERTALPSLRDNLQLIGIFVLLWLIPVGALLAWRGYDDVLVQEALFFTQAAFITFGGAYAVLTYIADMAVHQYGWLTTDQMIQGLGLAESTPGPLIMVTQYVGFVGAWQHSGPFPPLLYGTLGALITTYVTFLPCFLFIFLGAPYIEFLARQERLQAALSAVTAAVVGVIANLALFFGSNVLFPAGGALDVPALVLAIEALLLLRVFHFQIYWVVLLGAIAGMALSLLTQG